MVVVLCPRCHDGGCDTRNDHGDPRKDHGEDLEVVSGGRGRFHREDEFVHAGQHTVTVIQGLPRVLPLGHLHRPGT